MSLEFRLHVPDAHQKTILALSYNPSRREIYTASEDTTIRVHEAESGKLSNTLYGHGGWITGLYYCKDLKILFSASVDGFFIAWNPSGKLLQRVETGQPIYSLGYNSRRQQFLLGFNGKVRVMQINTLDDFYSGDIIDTEGVSCDSHSDVVSCVVSSEGRFYSGGFDKKLVIYETSHHGKAKLNQVHTVQNAHEAAISCMCYAKDADNSWIITGSFDKVVKLWSLDGNFLQRFDGFTETISAVTYVLPTRTLWICSKTAIAICDPRSGINVTEFVSVDEQTIERYCGKFVYRDIIYAQETSEVFAVTGKRAIVVWKFNPSASITTLNAHKDSVECLALSKIELILARKEPLLIFTGGANSKIYKWERMQLNMFMYSQDSVPLPKQEKSELDVKIKLERSAKNRRQQQLDRRRLVSKKLQEWKQRSLKNDDGIYPNSDNDWNKKKLVYKTESSLNKEIESEKSTKPSVTCMIYDEDVDMLICGFENSKICVWGYNDELSSLFKDSKTDDHITSRVSGLTCKFTLNEHQDVVTGLASLSTGWDRRICLWDLSNGKLASIIRNRELPPGKEEMAADDLILGLAYSKELQEIGYCSSDKCAYIRKVAKEGEEMKLKAVLQGHEAEVTQILWNPKHQQWITGSSDRTIRIWPAEGIPCLKVLNNESAITAMAVDLTFGYIISGSEDKVIRVSDAGIICQKYYGHADEIRSIIHIPERKQYVSASWDGSFKIWNAYVRKVQAIVPTPIAEGIPAANEKEESTMIPKLQINTALVTPTAVAKTSVYSKQMAKSKLDDEITSAIQGLETALKSEKTNRNKSSASRDLLSK